MASEIVQEYLRRQEQEKIRWAAIRQRAAATGLVLVRLTARRWFVIRRHSATGSVRSKPGGERYTHEDGSVACGPAPHEVCVKFLDENCPALPADLPGEGVFT